MKKHIILFLLFSSLLLLPFFGDTTYKVQKGDTLYSISRKYQITVAELRTANNLKESDVLKAGQKLIIPEADIGTAAALSTSKSAASSTVATQTVTYKVQKGDTLYGIARKNSMTVAELLSINNLDSSYVLKAGQTLKIKQQMKSSASTTVKTNKSDSDTVSETPVVLGDKIPDTRNYGTTVSYDNNTKWPVSNPKVTRVKGKVSGVQLSAKENENVKCIHEGTVMYVGVYRGFGQVVFVQTKTGLIYAYTGLGSVKVRKGDYLVGDAVIGTAGLDTLTEKPQITFMVFQNGQPIDPAKAPRS